MIGSLAKHIFFELMLVMSLLQESVCDFQQLGLSSSDELLILTPNFSWGKGSSDHQLFAWGTCSVSFHLGGEIAGTLFQHNSFLTSAGLDQQEHYTRQGGIYICILMCMYKIWSLSLQSILFPSVHLQGPWGGWWGEGSACQLSAALTELSVLWRGWLGHEDASAQG